MSDEDPVDALYGLPLDEFIAARDALAKEQRSGGDRETAAATKKLTKPSRAAWAVNAGIRENPDEAQALANAAERLREAQEDVMAGGDRDALREATADARVAVDALVEAGPASGEATEQKVRTTLQAALSDPDFLDEVLAGRVTREREASGFGGIGEMGAVAPASRGGSSKGGATKSRSSSRASGKQTGGTKKRAEKDRQAEEGQRAEEQREAEEERRAEEERKAEEEREETLRAAREREEEAEASVSGEEKAIAEIEAALHARRDQLHAAERELREARKARKRAER